MGNACKYNVGLVQMRMGPDPEANFAAAIAHIREAARRGANIVCLPELFRAQYFCQREDLRLRDHRRRDWPRWRSRRESLLLHRCLNGVRRGFITTQQLR
jgi:predicted amidohydrolase